MREKKEQIHAPTITECEVAEQAEVFALYCAFQLGALYRERPFVMFGEDQEKDFFEFEEEYIKTLGLPPEEMIPVFKEIFRDYYIKGNFRIIAA